MSQKILKAQGYTRPEPFTFGPKPDLIVKVHEGSKLIHIYDYPVESEKENGISHQLSVQLNVDEDGELNIYIFTPNGDTVTEMKIPTSLSRIQ